MALVFLDIDGVLNAHEWDDRVKCGQIHRDKVQLLNEVLATTDSHVVVSSAWRYIVHRGEMNLKGLEWLLRSHGMLADRLLGITRKDTTVDQPPGWNGDLSTWVVPNERGQQITDWLREHGSAGRRYVVLDDLDLGIRDAGHPFVQTNGKVGLTADDARRAVEILQGGRL